MSNGTIQPVEGVFMAVGSSPRATEVAADLRRRILNMEWAVGERLPSHRDLCEEYRVSDGVMQSARRMLIGEGILESRPGVGAYVRRPFTPRPTVRRYVEVAADLRRRIVERREWVPGERLPGHRDLCQEYQVSDSVMQSARRILIAEGVLETHPGAGAYVRQQTVRHELVRLGRGADGRPAALSMREQGAPEGTYSSWSSHSQTIPADRALAHQLRIEAADRVMMTEYQLLATGSVVRLTTVFEPYSVVGGTAVVLPDDGPLAGRGVVERMAAIGVTVQSAGDRIISRAATVSEGELLGGGTGAPVLEVSRTYQDADGRPVHVERTVVRGDRMALFYQVV